MAFSLLLTAGPGKQAQEVGPGRLVEGVDLRELPCCGQGGFRVACMSLLQFLQNAYLQTPQVFAFGHAPGLELVLGRQIEAFEEFAAETRRRRLELFRR